MKTVVGVFMDEKTADEAITALQSDGFDHNHIGLVAHEEVLQKVDRQEEIEEGTVTVDQELGTVGGAAVGGLTGLLIGVGALVIPGLGPILAAGTLSTALGTVLAMTGMGAATGGLVGALTSVGVTEEDAKTYANKVKEGGILVVVEVYDERVPVISEILKQAGAVEVRYSSSE